MGLSVRNAAVAVVAGALLLPASSTARPRYVQPRESEGMAFPVVRSNWYSVINFTNDWHDVRLRFENGKWRPIGIHEGTDIFAEPGTPIVAAFGGRVEQLGWTFYSGWRVGIRGDDGRYWFYAHMRRFAPGLSVGDRVDAGTRLGTVGNTGYGNALGHRNEFVPHLHFGVQDAGGSWVNPYPLLARLYARTVRASR